MKPKHKKAQYFLEQGLFAGLTKFSELENRIANLSSNEEKGAAFEVFAEAYFKVRPLCQVSEIWPETELPQNIRDQFKLPLADKGIDGIFKTHNDEYHAYQVKYRSRRDSLTWDALSTFMGLSDWFKHRVLFTNSSDLSDVMKDRSKFHAVQGYDLDRLEVLDFENIEGWLKTGVQQKQSKKSPWPHQVKAIAEILEEFKDENRAIAVMACGTGKTLVALWVAEQMQAQTILVLVPSLVLLQQILHDWEQQNNFDLFNYLCVCSDKDIDKGIDSIKLKQFDLDFSVTTQADDVERFLKNKSKSPKIIFSTYQSAHVVGNAMPQDFSFDLAIFDEAHKTASRENVRFSFALQDENLAITKRLFLTATPRHYNVQKKDKEGDQRIVYSMDDKKSYGEIAHEILFRDAVKQNIICDYKVIISVITSDDVNRQLLRQGEVAVEADIVKAERIANILAVIQAINQYDIKRIFSFHNSIASAESFTAHTHEGIGAYLSDFKSLHVNGAMSSKIRTSKLQEFTEGPYAIISNARCLTEGVNIPAVDMVAFISPKKSKIDIIQAVGRAMRKIDATKFGYTKEFGYVLIPLFLNLKENESIADALKSTKYDAVWDVLQAMKEQDENLVEIIGKMMEDKGKSLGFHDNILRERVEVLGMTIDLDIIRAAISTRIVEVLGCTWDERYGQLIKYKEEFGDCNVSKRDFKYPGFGQWVSRQRQLYNNNELSQERIKKLECIDFDWNPIDNQWNQMFSQLIQYKEIYGHCNISKKDFKNLILAEWVGKQRVSNKNGTLPLDRKNKLFSIGFNWDAIETKWQKRFDELILYKEQHGDCNVHNRYLDNQRLANWVGLQRKLYKKMAANKIQMLDDIDFDWEPIEFQWNQRFDELVLYKGKNGDCNISQIDIENLGLGKWVGRQRQLYNNNELPLNRKNKLLSIGFDWNPLEAKWNKRFSELIQYKKINGNCDVPDDYLNNPTLGHWIGVQRRLYAQGKLSLDQVEKLQNIGFDWDPLKTQWEQKYNELVAYQAQYGHCNVSKRDLKYSDLGRWVIYQRKWHKKNKLLQDRIDKLNHIGFDWEPLLTRVLLC